MILKFLENFSKNPPKIVKIAEVFFLRLSFHLMLQSELKVRSNERFQLVDNDAQRIRGHFPNHSTVRVCLFARTSHFYISTGLLLRDISKTE